MSCACAAAIGLIHFQGYGLILEVLRVRVVAVAAPAALAGPDVLAIAKRALRLAQEPPKVAHVFSEDGERFDARGYRITVPCPEGMRAVGLIPHPNGSELVSLGIRRRSGVAVFQLRENFPSFGPVWPGLTLTCVG